MRKRRKAEMSRRSTGHARRRRRARQQGGVKRQAGGGMRPTLTVQLRTLGTQHQHRRRWRGPMRASQTQW